MLAAQLAGALAEGSEHDHQVALMKFLSHAANRLHVGQHVYVVGGAVRDFVLGQPIKDVDMMIDPVALKGKNADWLAKQLQRQIPVATNLTTNRFGVAILTIKSDWDLDGFNMKGQTIDIATARKESYGGALGKGHKPSEVSPATAKDDMARREFTFNTLMWRLAELAHGPDKAEIVDITGCGMADLKAGVMRCPSDPDKTFADDPTRMLRAVKFLIRYGFRIDHEVEAAIRRNAKKLKNAPHETIAKLLVGVLKDRNGVKALREMKRLGLLPVVAQMIQSNKAFAVIMRKWAARQDLSELFELLDAGLPVNADLDFLTPAQQKRLRKAVVGMAPDKQRELVANLRQPGRAIGSRTFIPYLAKIHDVSKQDMGRLGARVADIVRGALLADPHMGNAMVQRAVTKSLRAEFPRG